MGLFSGKASSEDLAQDAPVSQRIESALQGVAGLKQESGEKSPDWQKRLSEVEQQLQALQANPAATREQVFQLTDQLAALSTELKKSRGEVSPRPW